MQPENSPAVATNPASLAKPVTNQAHAAEAWSTDFVVAQPAAMPSERMQARAELVGSATNCGGY